MALRSKGQTHLILVYTNIIPLIHASIDAERPHSAKDHLCSYMTVKRGPRKVDRKVSVAQVLEVKRVSSNTHKNNVRRDRK